MSTVVVTNLKHESATGNNIVLDSSGNTTLGGIGKVASLMHPSGAAAAIAMDSSGRVTMPSQPMASVALTSGNADDTSDPYTYTAGDIRFDLVFVNQGNCYSTSTGRFTAPVAGIYKLNASLLKSSTTGTTFYNILKNGSNTQVGSYSSSSGVYDQMAVSYLINLAANDYLSIRLGGGGFNMNTPSQDTWGCITFELVG